MNFKKIEKEYFPTILDRLTRFEPAHIRYHRVFSDIISKFSSNVKIKSLSVEEEIAIATEIFNGSLEDAEGGENAYDKESESINKLLINLEDKYFKFNELSYQYQSARLNISKMIEKLEKNSIYSKNLTWLVNLKNSKNILKERYDKGLLYPIEKIILCEGQTEYTLLNSIFNLFDYDLNKNGIIVIPAGGKNQVARKYYEMVDYVKLPFYILLDLDAKQIQRIIEAKLASKDKIYLISSGEFEDIIPKEILINTINFIHKNDYNCAISDFEEGISTVENLNNIYRKYGFGEYKKAHFAQNLKEYIINNSKKEDFLNSEIINFVDLIKNS